MPNPLSLGALGSSDFDLSQTRLMRAQASL